MKAFLAGKQVKMIIAACNTITFSVPPSFFAGKIPVIGMSLDFPELESVESSGGNWYAHDDTESSASKAG